MARIDLDEELAALEAMPLAQLRAKWSDCPPSAFNRQIGCIK